MKRRTLALLSLAGALSAQSPVTFDRILNADKEPQNWLSYSGTTRSQRYSLLTQITPDNVKNLELQWVFQSRSLEKYESTPLVVDGVMYTVQNPDDVVALDAATGRVFWTYSYPVSPDARPCCGRLSRGVAILGETLYIGTIDAHVVALDAKTGKAIWDIEVGKAASGYAITHAPQIVKDKVIVGMAGGEYGIRGYILALDAKTGKEAWRFYTIPGPGEPGHESWTGDSWKTGGASVWVTGSYDPDTNLTFWGIGNPGPDWNGDKRAGDNLYSDSVVALDADTGKLKWYYQFSPHDEFDYDSVQVPVLVDTVWQGRPRKLMMWANRNGLFYVLDRVNGQFLMGKPFVKVNWMNGFDERGRPMKLASAASSKEGTLILPGNQGGTNYYNPSYSPRTGLFYIPAWDNYSSLYVKQDQDFVEGRTFGGGGPRPTTSAPAVGGFNFRSDDDIYGAVRAIDPKTGEKKWEFKMADVTDAGILTTASDLLFTGGREGYFFALDARDGKLLWKASVGGPVRSGPMTYTVNGRQYVAVDAGNSLFVWALRQ
ncbi:MAG TPA: PQQ-dependent dehydrogenase, methanol/ethanol family [Bryobacteraceae bacterium]|jgi:alcohol dehydrogenase (cytochrome c)|nr:PQQ-dependent dehydrogenase, methanol/ethanol family [Bryobacteraceae bacterium]